VLGTYLHGLFDAASAGMPCCVGPVGGTEAPDYRSLREAGIERLADTVEACLDSQVLGGCGVLMTKDHGRNNILD
jgi:cobyric acid synthase